MNAINILGCLKCEILCTQRNSIDLIGVAIKSQNNVVKYLLLDRSLLMAEIKFSKMTEINVHRGF